MNRITLSIVSHGHGHFVHALLGDLSRQTIANRLDVILTLNIPEPEPDPSLYTPLKFTVVRNEAPKGFGTNHNAALLHADTMWVLVVNPDIRLDDITLIERMIDGVDGRVGLVAPLIRNSEGEREDSVRQNLDPISIFRRVILRKRTIVDTPTSRQRFIWVAGMFIALPLNAWRKVGGFDDRFFLYCEDYDICARLVQKGYAIKVDERLVAIHDAQRSSRRSATYFRWHVRSLLKVWTSSVFWKVWLADVIGPSKGKPQQVAEAERGE